MSFSVILYSFTWVLMLSAAVYASFVDDILNTLEKAVDCPTCHGIFTVLEPLALLGDSVFSSTLIAVCKAAKVSSQIICIANPIANPSVQRSRMMMYVRASSTNRDPLLPTIFVQLDRSAHQRLVCAIPLLAFASNLPWHLTRFSLSNPPSHRPRSGRLLPKPLSKSSISVMCTLTEVML